LKEAHETYRLAQALPGWDPTSETSDFQLQVIAQVHGVYERVRAENEAEQMRKMLGG